MSRYLNDQPTTSSRLSLGVSTLKSPKSRLLDDIDLFFPPAGDFDYSQSESSIELFNRDVDNIVLFEQSAIEKTKLGGRPKMNTI